MANANSDKPTDEPEMTRERAERFIWKEDDIEILEEGRGGLTLGEAIRRAEQINKALEEEAARRATREGIAPTRG